MVFFNEPLTLAKVAEYHGNLEDAIDSFNFGAEMLERSKEVIRFGLYKTIPRPYLLVVSHYLTKNDLVLSITSNSDKLNSDIEKRFAQKLNLELKDANLELSEATYYFGKKVFPVFQNYGDQAMNGLKRR
jgi:hypothetical protein